MFAFEAFQGHKHKHKIRTHKLKWLEFILSSMNIEIAMNSLGNTLNALHPLFIAKKFGQCQNANIVNNEWKLFFWNCMHAVVVLKSDGIYAIII